MAGGRASQRLSFRIAPEDEEQLVAELWALGTRGIQVQPEATHSVLLDAYFDADQPLGDLAPTCQLCHATLIAREAVPERDWLADYRAGAQPFTVGRFQIDPGEPDARHQPAPSPAAGTQSAQHHLRIPARNAFGTGSHESTRLMLELLADLDLAGNTVLDVGTGSGILAFAALQLGAESVTGFDLDPGSVVSARDNAGLNELWPRLFCGRVEAVAGRFDRVLVNILPERWLGESAAVSSCVRPGGELLVSGLLLAQRATTRAALAPFGLTLASERRSGEWAALRLRASKP